MATAMNTALLAAGVAAVLVAPVQGAELTLVLSGSAYAGPPAYDVSVGGVSIASGVVEMAIDGSESGPNAWKSGAAMGKTVTVTLPDLTGAIEIRLTNDLSAGRGKDRNLFLVSASLDGAPLDLSAVEYIVGGQAKPPVFVAGMLGIWHEFDVASIALAPPPVASAEAAAVTETVAVEPVETADVSNACEPSREVVVSGFATNSWDLPEEAETALTELATALEAQGCTISVTGYASLQGPPTWNTQLANLRAESVLDFLVSLGAGSASLGGDGGPTDRFGASPADNQRVVVAVGAAQ